MAPAYGSLPKVRAIIVAGSAAEGVSDFHSDLDMGVYYDELPSEAALEAARRANGGSERLWVLGDRAEGDFAEAFAVDGVECQVFHVTVAAWERDMAVVLDQHEAKTPLQKAMQGMLECVPLHGGTLAQEWKARAAAYPEALRVKMVEEHLVFFPLWYLGERMAVRDATLWTQQALLEAAQNILGVLAGLNRLYYTTFQFKRMRSFIGKMQHAPPDLGERLESLFRLEPQAAAAQLESLVRETLDLVETHMPQVDTARARRRLGQRLEAWKPA
jgi:hypothetical protein